MFVYYKAFAEYADNGELLFSYADLMQKQNKILKAFDKTKSKQLDSRKKVLAIRELLIADCQQYCGERTQQYCHNTDRDYISAKVR